jgi:hypothetical protein
MSYEASWGPSILPEAPVSGRLQSESAAGAREQAVLRREPAGLSVGRPYRVMRSPDLSTGVPLDLSTQPNHQPSPKMMWSSATLRSSASRNISSSGSGSHAVVAGGTTRRWFSDSERGGGRGGRGGGGGGRGRRSSGRGGRGDGSFNRFRELRHGKKPNFAKTVLEPAARGELQKNHQSGIPKLAARKGKSHKVHDEALVEPHETRPEEMVDATTFPGEEEVEAGLVGGDVTVQGSFSEGGGVRVTYQSGAQPVLAAEEDTFYDSEDEFDGLQEDEMIHDLSDHPDIVPNEDGTHTLFFDPDEYFGTGDGQGGGRRGGDNEGKAEFRDPEAAYFLRRFWDNPNLETERIPKELYNRVLPLADHGPDFDDFLEASLEHPARYAMVTRYNHHPEYEREPKPDAPKSRLQPSEEFVTSHKRFLFVTGLPRYVTDGEVGDFDNPVHRYEVVKMVSDIFVVDPEHVSPANMTSAFIGYTDKQKFYDAQRNGPSKRSFENPVQISKYSGSEYDDFVKDSNAVVEFSNLPPGMSAARLSHALFPADTELGSVYGPVASDQILLTSATTALIRFESAEKADSAVSSGMLSEHLKKLGTSRIQYFKARRVLVHAGFGGPNKCREFKKRGNRLVVDGDAPSPEFYRSHAGVIHLRHLDPSATKQELAEIFQPFSMDRRDVSGSVEFVTCAEGLRTDRAFVGFDALGEAENAVKACSGLFQIGNSKAIVRLVRDKHQYRLERNSRKEPQESRPMRDQEEILNSLNNWEQFVDPDEIEELEKHGVRKDALDDIFRTMRFHNKTYGPLDQALTRERLTPGRAAGDDYRETVREYIDTLKECIATPEQPGLIYESLFFPNEELDMSIFDMEKERQAKLREKRTGISS